MSDFRMGWGDFRIEKLDNRRVWGVKNDPKNWTSFMYVPLC
jgi:hypothetical protein